MVNWFLDLITRLEHILYKAGRRTQLLVALIAGLAALANTYALYGMFTGEATVLVDPMRIIILGALTVATGYIAIISLIYCAQDSRRHYQAGIVAHEKALQQAKDQRNGSTPPFS